MMLRVSLEEALKRGWIKPDPIPKAIPEPPKKSGLKKAEREGVEQSQLIEEFNQLHSEYARLLIHIPNGGSRKNAFEGWRLKKQGVKPGVSDLSGLRRKTSSFRARLEGDKI